MTTSIISRCCRSKDKRAGLVISSKPPTWRVIARPKSYILIFKYQWFYIKAILLREILSGHVKCLNWHKRQQPLIIKPFKTTSDTIPRKEFISIRNQRQLPFPFKQITQNYKWPASEDWLFMYVVKRVTNSLKFEKPHRKGYWSWISAPKWILVGFLSGNLDFKCEQTYCFKGFALNQI